MKNRSRIYRLFSLFMAVLVVMNIALPSALLAAHCDMDKQLPISEIGGEHCPQLEAHSNHASHDQQNRDCDWTLSCACELDQQQIKAEAIPTISKTAKTFVVSVVQYIDIKPTDTPSFFVDTGLYLHTETLPLFLLNSVFLN
jgi:hypothetical protein